MKRAAFFILASLSLIVGLPAQAIIENPDKPLRKDAGRVLQLKEVWRITDEGGQFYFRYPEDLKISSDGHIFYADEKELLKFSPDGKFIKNLYKKGQGPGEIESDFAYFVKGGDIYIYDFMTIKIVKTDLNGTLIDQTRIETGPYNGFCGLFRNWLIFLKDVFPPPAERKSKVQDISCLIKLVSSDGKIEKESCVFQRQMFLSPTGVMNWSTWRSVLSEDNERLYVCHTREYLIEGLDLNKNRVVNRFRRKYPSVKYKERGWEKNFYARYDAPKIGYEIDISGLFTDKDRLWVKTSTTDKEKGDMFDVFDAEGRFIDSFYLGADRTLLIPNGDELFVLEKDREENFILIKYKIAG